MEERRSDGEGKRGANGQELLTRYAAGEREFCNVSLSGAELSGANLSDADFSGANLSGAKLFDANLTGAKLSDAILYGADLSHADFSAANLVGANLTRANLFSADFFGANMNRANFSQAALQAANLYGTTLYGANLKGASLSRANLTGALLARADLSRADLSRANLSGVNLSGVNLSGVDLTETNLSDAKLSETDFGRAKLCKTLLLNVDLTSLCAADPSLCHRGPSYVDDKSILRSVCVPNLKDFLARTGMSEVFVEYMIDCARSLKTDMFKMLQSTFISYGAPDETFARKLYEALHRNGVTTFFFPEHAEPGEKLHRMMRKGVNEHDRVILICSRNSLDRKGVLNELEEILTREARDGGASYLIPIRLDDYVFGGWKPPNADVAQAVRDRVVADFEGANEDQAKFQVGLQKLIRALRKKTVEAGDVRGN
ncbi:toll/interleukin-1 receptor domain-containing protein [Sorangium sp. So ce260]|uniref:toll/interleukin-1 receptor domain-containing protein n=1 Tax=Sorangium sp. So ce260 TaxID=3133291 RepID=UPI003F5E302A